MIAEVLPLTALVFAEQSSSYAVLSFARLENVWRCRNTPLIAVRGSQGTEHK